MTPGKSKAYEELGEVSTNISVNFADEEQQILHKRHTDREDEMFQSFLEELQKEAREDDAFSKRLECNNAFIQGIHNVGELKQL